MDELRVIRWVLGLFLFFSLVVYDTYQRIKHPNPIVLLSCPEIKYHNRAMKKIRELCAERYPDVAVREYHPLRINDDISLRVVCREALDRFPRVIICTGAWCSTRIIAMAKHIKQDVPIVFIGADACVERGWCASLEEPGGNVTGAFSSDQGAAMSTAGLVRLLLPRAQKVLMPFFYAPHHWFEQDSVEAAQADLAKSGVEVKPLLVNEYSTLFEMLKAYLPAYDSMACIEGTKLDTPIIGMACIAARHRVPFISPLLDSVSDAAFTFAVDPQFAATAAFELVEKILAGTSPAVLPVAQVQNARTLFINAPVCHACGITDDDIATILDRIEHEPAYAPLRGKVTVMHERVVRDIDFDESLKAA